MSLHPSRSQRQRPRRMRAAQRGVALLVAILLVALGTIIAATVSYENVMTARRGVATFAFDQAFLISEGAEAIAASVLRQLVQGNAKQTIYVGQGWDKTYGPLEVVDGSGMMLTAQLEDLQGRFNLNSLVDNNGQPNVAQVTAFKALLANLGIEERWAGLMVDWIDMDLVASIPDGAEDSTYLGQTPPYLTANRYITSPSELMALPGFGRDRYLKLAPFVTALPHGVQLNICTAPGEVLDAYIGGGHTEYGGAQAENLAQNRANAGTCFPAKADYQKAFTGTTWTGTRAAAPTGTTSAANPTGQAATVPGVSTLVGQSSNYFRLTSVVTIGSTEFNLYSLLYMDGTMHQVRAIQRSFSPD